MNIFVFQTTDGLMVDDGRGLIIYIYLYIYMYITHSGNEGV